ncbi:MAG: MBL fold metallo-hydrolase [Candidatus Saccharimonadales bacterium]
MDLQYHGANCVVLSNKDFRVVVDDNLEEIGLKSVIRPDDTVLFTARYNKLSVNPRLLIDQPGEYEVANLSVIGIAAQGHTDTAGAHTATMYKIMVDDTNYFFTGHIYSDLNDDQLEAIGVVDVMFVPIGGNGYTLDATGALQLIKKIEPKLVIPTHYADKDIRYPVEQQNLDQALKNLGMEPKETITKLRFKSVEALSGTTQLVILNRT